MCIRDSYDPDEALSGVEVASFLGQNPDRVFKTLVTVGKSGTHYVFMVPVASELDLKKAAAAAGEKNIAMVKSRELLGLTGYVPVSYTHLDVYKRQAVGEARHGSRQPCDPASARARRPCRPACRARFFDVRVRMHELHRQFGPVVAADARYRRRNRIDQRFVGQSQLRWAHIARCFPALSRCV